MILITQCYPIHMPPKRLIPPVLQVSLKKAFSDVTKLALSLSNGIAYYYIFYFFAGNVFYSFILALMPSYRAYRFLNQ